MPASRRASRSREKGTIRLMSGMTTTWAGPDAIRLKFCPAHTDFVSN